MQLNDLCNIQNILDFGMFMIHRIYHYENDTNVQLNDLCNIQNILDFGMFMISSCRVVIV